MDRNGDRPVSNGDAVREEALAWFVRRQSGDADTALSPAERAAFEDWLARDPSHRREYDRLAGLWTDIGALPDPRRTKPVRRAPKPTTSPVLSRRRILTGGVACAAALAAVTVLPTWRNTVRSGTGERRTLALTDGSTIEMDAGSALTMEVSEGERRVALTAGRARFVVAPDSARPFVVSSANGVLETSKAVFVVHRRPDGAVVAVEDGTLALSVNDGAPERLTAGQCRPYCADGLRPPIDGGVAMETAWRQGRLVFQDQRLETVVADLNRYHPAHILLWDDSIAGLRVEGSVDIARPDAALKAITRTLPVRTVQLSPYLVLLHSA
ncbi:FecR family protein [Azospirillum doebereinerae]|uniref:FecR family protein n=1 Tax=Azospirillum doebereinerae TaxID=92933 RepID=A0A3S0XM08_9PROT|nr:FecR family protein [Azospirillum doebereinerae]RUQ69354.1 FecR family protein [Azospirillum doebereinerae]